MTERNGIADAPGQPREVWNNRIPPEVLIPVLAGLLAEGREVPLTVTGNSMSPFLEHRRDSVILSPPEGEIRSGDIVLYRATDSRYILHRVRCIAGGVLYTAGDGRYSADPPAAADSVVAVIHTVRRKGKLINEKSPLWRYYARIWGRFIVLRRPALWIWNTLHGNTMRDIR